MSFLGLERFFSECLEKKPDIVRIMTGLKVKAIFCAIRERHAKNRNTQNGKRKVLILTFHLIINLN